ncbi:hypothetical protein vBKpnSCarvaje_0030 [Klebsiella phage vB_KpnS-Carvaje]|uniref:DUF7740 domain-containing protein n=1 Tax=Klebsiella phage vB_KpnS-Carvaje TaxID=2900314 RepID=A0AAE8ZCE4_9CAUD|nr:hypothetical protein PQD67_gp030 [Klebsiella phage vB_KpnS-Carvaje]UJQ43994.1 hypothetical protein vBKpnSCarvaje_0030 [Klebsiella phage vB_KpnS-Carvaje]
MNFSHNLERSAEYSGYPADHPKVIGVHEFIDIVVTLQLCVAMNKDKPNTALKRCAQVLKQRMTMPNTIKMLDVVLSQPFPSGYVAKLQRLLIATDREVGQRMINL